MAGISGDFAVSDFTDTKKIASRLGVARLFGGVRYVITRSIRVCNRHLRQPCYVLRQQSRAEFHFGGLFL